MKDSDKTLNKAVTATCTSLLGLYGIGPAALPHDDARETAPAARSIQRAPS